MLQLLMLIALAPAGSIPEGKMQVQDPRGAVAVTDKYLLPSRPPDCKNEAEVQKAVEQVRNGERGECWVRDVSAFNRRR
jgi:hypothetical protein